MNQLNYSPRVMTETVISIPGLAKRLGKAINTIERWKKQGLKGKKLEVYKDGGRYKTSIEAYERFTAPDTNGADPPPPPSVTDRVEWELIDNMVNAGEIVRTGLKLVDGKTVSIN